MAATRVSEGTGEVVRLQGERVLVRPVAREEVDRVLELRARTEGFAPDPSRADTVRERFLRSGRMVDGRLDLAIEAEGRLVGEIDARQPVGAMPPGVFELGIALYDAADRGRGYGREAVELITRHLFEHAGAGRVQASTDVANRAMRSVLEACGFAREGVLRSFMPAEDGRHDYLMYAITIDDWSNRR